jgi:hypothetical protein
MSKRYKYYDIKTSFALPLNPYYCSNEENPENLTFTFFLFDEGVGC